MTQPPVLKRNWILAALMLTMMLAAMDVTIISTVIPQIVEDLGGFNKFSWVFSSYLLIQTATIPLYGKLADLYGRKKVLIFGIFVFLLASAAAALSWNIDALIFFRGVQGLGAGSIMATVNTIAGDIYTVEERAKIQGWLSSIWGISAIVGPALGGALVKYVSWRWIFYINIPLGAVAIFLLYYFLKEQLNVQKPKIDYLGAVLIFVTLSLFITFLLNGGRVWDWNSIPSITLIILTFLLAYLTIKVERRAEAPIIPLWMWTNRSFLGSNLAMLGMGIIMMGPQTYLPTFTQASLGLEVVLSGLILASMSIGWPTASALSGKFYLNIGFRNTAMIGIVIVILACANFLLVSWPQPTYFLVLNQVMLGAGFGLMSTPILVGVQTMVGWEQRGVVTGATLFGRNLGQSIGAAVYGAIFNASLTFKMKESKVHFSDNGGNIIETLHSTDISATVKESIQLAINFSFRHIYVGMLIIAVLSFVALNLMPKITEKLEEKS